MIENNLDAINHALNSVKKDIENFANKVDFIELCEFTMENYKEQINWSQINISGLYMFKIKTDSTFENIQDWISNFKELWENIEYKWKFVPNSKKYRILQHKNFVEFIPLYLGKSKNIKTRVYDHINKDLEKNTFALKLKARKNIENSVYKLFYLPIDCKENYDWVVPFFENKMRNIHNPILGKQ